ncbi:MAG: GGDEF domain-containing protein, partial [Spirochaetota bacterium]
TVGLVLDQALNVVPYDTATVQLLRSGVLEVIGGSGWEDIDTIRGLRIPCPGYSPHSRAIETRNALVVRDVVEEFPRFTNISDTEIRSWLGIPLIVHGEVIGLLAFDSGVPDFFTTKHVRLAAALGDHVAVAIQNARLYEQTRALAMTDSLTGVATRRSFFVEAERALEQAKRSNRFISVIMADLDNFKLINDQYGHARGDEAIRLAAEAAEAVLRRSDVIGRYGGEEFSVFLPDTDEAAAETTAERLRTQVGEIVVPGTTQALSVSIGVVSRVPDNADTVDSILEKADRAMYAAKHHGRNRVEVYREP